MAIHPMPLITEKVKARFWSKVQKTGDCWNWTAARNQKGYGVFGITADKIAKNYLAHRVSLYIAGIHHPINSFALHSCDNPACVRTDHLRWGTLAENVQDMFLRNRNVPIAVHRKTMKKAAVRGAKHRWARIPDHVIQMVLNDTRIHREIADEYGLSRQYVGDLKRGRRRAA